MSVKNKWKMWLRTAVLVMWMFFHVEAGRFKKQGSTDSLDNYKRRDIALAFFPSFINILCDS